MTNPCKEKEPRVIDNVLLETCIQEQSGKDEAGRLAREEGIIFNEVERLRLEYLNILRIDHLWMLSSLTKLSLGQNYIEKIENLEALVNLKELDLSFNKISKIENLEALVNLEVLTLYENKISSIENMDTLKKLTIFSIGKNNVSDNINVIYMRQFKNLTSLSLAGNPCAADKDFRIFIAAFLPQITYFEYKMIMPDELVKGCEMFRLQLDKLEEVEARDREVREKYELEVAEAEKQADSFVEYLSTDYLFRQMFENDTEGRALLGICDEGMDYFNEFQQQLVAVCHQLFEYGQEQYHKRHAEMSQFQAAINSAKDENQTKSIGHMEEFLQKKADFFFNVRKLHDDLENNEINMEEFKEGCENFSAEYNIVIHDCWKILMGLEMTLFDQIEDANLLFEQSITEMINTFTECAQGHFTTMRDLQQTYNENMSELANRYLTLSNSEDYEMPEELKPFMAEKELLINTLGASNDVHLLTIDNREDHLINRAKQWIENLVLELQNDEITRNRSKILEINHFLDIQREEFDDLLEETAGVGLDPELSAVFN